MFFNSIEFCVFLPIVFLLYWFVFKRNIKHQNILLIIASYIFYGWWDWRFLSLIIFSSSIDYLIGNALAFSKNRKLLISASIIINLGVLVYFKYFNFFIDSFVNVFTFLGKPIKHNSLDVILPVGISFYTFQTMSYTIDIYRNKLKPSKDIFSFFAFVSFFPQLVAGPIERASDLLPQFYKKRKFLYNNAVDGLRQVLWGLFKKVVIADNCAEYANEIFNNYLDYSGSTLTLGAIFFTFQIYGDFSGYSDIAIGVSRLFGFNLKKNFSTPYFSRDIAEFWRRWHISLSTWFRDYLYIPIGGSRGSILKQVRNVFVIFIVSGLWHGANWTFIVWGALNALYFLPLLLTNKNRSNTVIVAQGKLLPNIKEILMIFRTFLLTVLAWVFFRADTVEQALYYISSIFSKTLFSIPEIRPSNLILLICFFLIIEWLGREEEHIMAMINKIEKKYFRWSFYILVLILIFIYQGKQQEFIYFQF